MKVRKSKGVLAKDGKTPWAAGTLHVVDRDTDGGKWCTPSGYSMTSLALCMMRLAGGKVDSVELIDENNDKYVFELTAEEKRRLA